MTLILSIFPGVDLLGRAFEEEWPEACIVRGPDLIFGGDVRGFYPPAGKFDGIIGGPPCQIFSRMRYIQPKSGQKHGNLIPEFERCVREAQPCWFLMENVPEAPEPSVANYIIVSELVRDVWVGGETNRMRRFTFGAARWSDRLPGKFQTETLALHRMDARQAVLAGGARRVPVALKASGNVKSTRRVCAGDMKTQEGLSAALQAQGLPPNFLDDAPFTVAGKIKVIGNGVPIALGRAVAKAVKRALAPVEKEEAAA